VRCGDLAEDAVQEALLAYVRLGSARPLEPERWLSRAVVHRSLQILRSRSRRRKHEDRACSCRQGWVEWSEAERRLESRELGERILAGLDAMPPVYREVFQLREFERLDYETIATRLGVPVGTIRSRLSRSRSVLQRYLDDAGLSLAGSRRGA
jgi:RNA polymerase sigma-70 factor (ECF subfamily)